MTVRSNITTAAVCAFVLTGCAAGGEPRTPAPPESGGAPPTEAGAARRIPDSGRETVRREAREAGTTKMSPSGAAAWAQVDENLAKLAALDVFEVGALVVALPAEASHCYGPCPGSEPVIKKAQEEAALRLATFVEEASTAAKQPTASLCTEVVDENLAQLQKLAIVHVAGIVKTQPANNPSCYNHPCQSDIAAARAINERRAAALDSIVRRTR